MPQLRLSGNSSSIASASYDLERRELTIVFTSGREYTYYGVPPEVADGLEGADSPGRYFNTVIREQYG